MNGRWKSAGFLTAVLAATVLAALWGCRDDGKQLDSHRPAAAARTAARTTPALRLPPMIDSVVAPNNFATVKAYIASLAFVDDAESTFPAWEQQQVFACYACASALVGVTILPEEGSNGLHPKDFTDSVRIIAFVELDGTVQGSGTAELNDLGLPVSNPQKHSYLVTIADSAWFIWSDNTAFHKASVKGRAFRANVDAHRPGFPMARWFRKPHSNHLNGTWVACAEGCCTSFAVA